MYRVQWIHNAISLIDIFLLVRALGRNDYRQSRGGYNRDESYGRGGRAEDYQSRGNNNRYSSLAYEQEDYQGDHYSGRGGDSRGRQSYSNYDEQSQRRKEHDAYGYRAPVISNQRSSNQRSPNQPDRADYRSNQLYNQDHHPSVDTQTEVQEIL